MPLRHLNNLTSDTVSPKIEHYGTNAPYCPYRYCLSVSFVFFGWFDFHLKIIVRVAQAHLNILPLSPSLPCALRLNHLETVSDSLD